MGKRKRVDIVRHGRSIAIERELVQGSADILEDGQINCLSDLGGREVQCLCDALSGETYDAILASGLTRVRQTAEALKNAVKGDPSVEFYTELTERGLGKYTLQPYKSIELCGFPSLVSLLTLMDDPDDDKFNPHISPKPGVGCGQKFIEVAKQTRNFYRSLLIKDPERILIVTSDIRMQYLIGEILGVRRRARISQNTCGINRFQIYWPDVGAMRDPFVEVGTLNFVEHLKGLYLDLFGREGLPRPNIPAPSSSQPGG